MALFQIYWALLRIYRAFLRNDKYSETAQLGGMYASQVRFAGLFCRFIRLLCKRLCTLTPHIYSRTYIVGVDVSQVTYRCIYRESRIF